MIINFLFEKVLPLFKKKNEVLDDKETTTVQDLLTYPPKVYGVPTLSAEQVVSFHTVQIKSLIPSARMRLNSEGEEPCFENLYKETLINFAEYCHLLPASEFHHHHEVGGLFYHSMETALGCLEYAKARDGDIPKDEDEYAIDIQSQLKPVWHYAAWCLGLLHDLGKIVIDMKVISADKNSECPPWDALNETLIEWSRENGVKRYRPIWNPHRNHQEHQSMSGVLFQKIVSKAGQRYLAQGGAKVRTQVINYLNGRVDTQAFLHKIVLEVDSKVTKEDMSMRWDRNLGDVKIGIEKAFISTLKILKPKLKINTPNGSVFVVGGSVFVRQDLLNKIIQTCKKEGYNSIPSESKVFAITLIERGIITPYSEDYWFYNLTSNDLETDRAIQVVELASPILFFDGKIPNSISATLHINPIEYTCNINALGERTVVTQSHLPLEENAQATAQVDNESLEADNAQNNSSPKTDAQKAAKKIAAFTPSNSESELSLKTETETEAKKNQSNTRKAKPKTDAQKAADKIAALKMSVSSEQHFSLKTENQACSKKEREQSHKGRSTLKQTQSNSTGATNKNQENKSRRIRKNKPVSAKLHKSQISLLNKLSEPSGGWCVIEKQIQVPIDQIGMVVGNGDITVISKIKTSGICNADGGKLVFSELATSYLVNRKQAQHKVDDPNKRNADNGNLKVINLAEVEQMQNDLVNLNHINNTTPAVNAEKEELQKTSEVKSMPCANAEPNKSDEKLNEKLKALAEEFNVKEQDGCVYIRTEEFALMRRKLSQEEFKTLRKRPVIRTEIDGVSYMLIFKREKE